MAAEVLTMCCFFGAAWVHPCCIGMIRVDSYTLSKGSTRQAQARAWAWHFCLRRYRKNLRAGQKARFSKILPLQVNHPTARHRQNLEY
jgi:hypothetical protein